MIKHKLLTLFAAMFCSFAMMANTVTGQCGEDLTYTYDTETKILTISGTGDMYDFNYADAVPWYSVRNYVKQLVLSDDITHIGDYAFYDFRQISTIQLPSQLQSIGKNAFHYCQNLTAISFPQSMKYLGNEAFWECDKLATVNLNDNLESIGNEAFWYCAFRSITIPASVTHIGNDVFGYCDNLSEIIMEGTTPPDLGGSLDYYGHADFRIFVPCGSEQNWKEDGSWYQYGDKIFGQTTYNLSLSSDGNGTTILKESDCSTNTITFEAIPNDYYIFYKWSDNSTVNPRTITLTADKSLKATFARNPDYCHVIILGNRLYCEYQRNEWGNISNLYDKDTIDIFVYKGSTMTFREEGIGYCGNWLGWSDGSKEPSRSIVVNSDMELRSLRDVQTYHVSITAGEGGYLHNGDIIGDYSSCGDYISVEAIANEGYSFAGWSDGNTNSYREIYLTQDITLVATFIQIKMVNAIFLSNNDQYGYVTGSGMYETGQYAHAEATANNGYHFVCWSDGETRNYRSIYLTQDTTLTAIFAKGEFGGKCGEDLYWSYEMTPAVLTITGEGEMNASVSKYEGTWRNYNYEENDNYYWVPKIKTISLPEGLLNIDYLAFKDCRHLQSITIPATVVEIEESAFEDCRSLQSVTFAGDNVQFIGDWAFYNCHELQNITIPEGVQEIGQAAFFNCVYLNELTIPSTMIRMADNSFAQCAKLKKMTVKAINPPVIDAKTFEGVDRNIPVIVPQGSELLYSEAEYWCEFINISPAPMGIDQTFWSSKEGSLETTKFLHNGQVIIKKNDKTFTILGQEL